MLNSYQHAAYFQHQFDKDDSPIDCNRVEGVHDEIPYNGQFYKTTFSYDLIDLADGGFDFDHVSIVSMEAEMGDTVPMDRAMMETAKMHVESALENHVPEWGAY